MIRFQNTSANARDLCVSFVSPSFSPAGHAALGSLSLDTAITGKSSLPFFLSLPNTELGGAVCEATVGGGGERAVGARGGDGMRRRYVLSHVTLRGAHQRLTRCHLGGFWISGLSTHSCLCFVNIESASGIAHVDLCSSISFDDSLEGALETPL